MTLVEVLVSAAILAILMGGMASAVALASKAIPKSGANASAAQTQASVAEAMEQMDADLAFAKTVPELTATAITVTVADRGHGTAGDETIRYAWSGVAGTPLTRAYNGGAAQTLVESVSSFSLVGTAGAGTLMSPPRVMLVVGNSGSLSSNDTARKGWLTKWGFPTTIVDDGSSAAAFAAAAAVNDVAWYGSDISSLTIYGSLPNPSIGVVVEKYSLLYEFGFCVLPVSYIANKVEIVDNTHEITSVFPLGALDVTKSSQPFNYASGTLAPGRRVLIGRSGTPTDPAMMVIEVGGQTRSGAAARGRRVEMPWGGSIGTALDCDELRSDAIWLQKRSLVWAAAPVVYSRVSVSITAGRASTVTRTIDLLNQPGVPKP